LKVSLRELHGPWDCGWALDKHTIGSVCIGRDEDGRPIFDTERTEIGEAVYRLKYRGELTQAVPLAQAVAANICPRFARVDAIVPMPASQRRVRQPVGEVAAALGRLLGRPVFPGLLTRRPPVVPMKNLPTKAEKIDAIGDSFGVIDRISGGASRSILLLDDLFDTGATMEAACGALRAYTKIGRIYAAALTWK
jgi:predicted amidophosphoribosyltransferase